MSYSFSVSAKTKDEAKAKVDAEMAKVIETQPRHKDDKEQAMATVNAVLDIITDPDERGEVVVSVSGSLAWNDEGKYTSASVNANAYSTQR